MKLQKKFVIEGMVVVFETRFPDGTEVYSTTMKDLMWRFYFVRDNIVIKILEMEYKYNDCDRSYKFKDPSEQEDI